MSKWLNTKKVVWKSTRIERPCHSCWYCPYGQLVEEFPLSRGVRKCRLFGHDCPVYFLAEKVIEGHE